MPDLSHRVRAAIEETMRIAREATPGPWYAPPPDDIAEWSIYGDDWMIASTHHYPRTDMRNEATRLRKPATVVEHANANAAHIAHNDPAVTLRRCEADLRTLDRHGEKNCLVDNEDECCTCYCMSCGVQWPCPDLLDRAAAYGVPVEEST